MRPQIAPKTLLSHLLLIPLALASTLHASDRKVYVKEARFAEMVDSGSKECAGKSIDASSKEKFSARTLFLWTRLAGDRAAYFQLEKDKKLPIKHVWKFGGSLDDEKVPAKDEQESLADENQTSESAKPIAVGSLRGLAALLFELTKNGFFDWRTWSHRLNVASGKYTVEVRYADDTPVTDGDHPHIFVVRYVKTR